LAKTTPLNGFKGNATVTLRTRLTYGRCASGTPVRDDLAPYLVARIRSFGSAAAMKYVTSRDDGPYLSD